MAPRLLPDGTPASSEEAYAEAWMRAGATFGTLLPGWRFAGCGPNLEFVRYSVTGLGDTIIVDRLSISPEAARTIQAAVSSAGETERTRIQARVGALSRWSVAEGFNGSAGVERCDHGDLLYRDDVLSALVNGG